MKRWQTILLGLVVSAATLLYALHGINLQQLGDAFAHGNYLYVVPAFLLTVAGLALRSFRWRSLLNDRIQTIRSFHILNISYLLNTILPLRLGEVARAYLTTRLDLPISMFTSLSSMLVERLLDVLAVVIAAVIAVAITTTTVDPSVTHGADITGAVAIIGMVLLAIFAARPTLAHRMIDLVLRIVPALERIHIRELTDRVLEGIAPLGSVRQTSAAVFWTVVGWISSLITTYLLVLAFFPTASFNTALFMTSITSLAVALPAVPGSVGPFEAGMVAGLTIAGVVSATNPDPRAFACAVVIHIVTAGTYAFLGVIGLAQEKISLGEVLRSARQMATRQKAAPETIQTPAE